MTDPTFVSTVTFPLPRFAQSDFLMSKHTSPYLLRAFALDVSSASCALPLTALPANFYPAFRSQTTSHL